MTVSPSWHESFSGPLRELLATDCYSAIPIAGDYLFFTNAARSGRGRHGVRLSITARKNKAVTAAMAAIRERAWTPIRYPRGVFDETDPAVDQRRRCRNLVRRRRAPPRRDHRLTLPLLEAEADHRRHSITETGSAPHSSNSPFYI